MWNNLIIRRTNNIINGNHVHAMDAIGQNYSPKEK